MRRTSFTIILAMLLILAFAMPAAASQVIIDGKRYNATTASERGITLVPLRGIFEALGANVTWDSGTKTVTATKDGTTVKLQLGRKTAHINDQLVALQVPGKIISGNTMVPLRFVSEALGASVNWDGSTQTVIIDTNIVFENNLIGIWTGTYTANQGETALTLTISEDSSKQLSAIFNFGPTPNNPKVPYGSYRMSVVEMGNNKVRLVGNEWIHQPPGYVILDLLGQLPGGTGVFSGEVYNSGGGALGNHKFTLRRVKNNIQNQDLVGDWTGNYRANQGETSLNLRVIEDDIGQLTAFFEFGPTPNNPNVPFGRYKMSVINGPGGIVKLVGEKWLEQPPNYVMVDLIGQIDQSKGLFTGSVIGANGKTFNVRRK